MKKATNIFGILSTLFIIAGVIHKTLHLPGAMYLLIFGLGVFLPVYLVLICIQKVKESQGLEKAMHIVKYISYGYMAMGFLFFLLHLPGALIIMDSGLVIFVLGYLTLKFMVHRRKHPDGGALNKIIPSLIIVVLIFALASRNMGERIFESIAYSDMQVNKMSGAVDTSLNHLMTEFEFNKAQFPAQVIPKYEKAVKIKKMSDEMVDYMYNCKREVIKLSCKEEITDTLRLDELSGRNKSAGPGQYFMGTQKDGADGKAYEIKERLKLFNDSVNIILESDSANKIMLPIMMDGYTWKSTGEEISWEIAMFHDNMLINDLAYMDLLILSVKQTQKDILTSLLLEARSDAMWTFWKKYKELVPGQNTK
jgi:hypothetical protein